MRSRHLCVPALLLLLVVSVTAAADDLWEQAVSHFALYQDLLPGRMTIRFDQYNGRGKLVSSEYSEIEVEVGPDGEIQGNIILAIKDGRDITEKRQDDPPSWGGPFGGGGDDGGDSPFAGLTMSPFDPDEQQRVIVADTGRTERIGPATTRVMTFRHNTSEDGSTTGSVWLDTRTGAPLKLVAGIEPLPGYVDELEIIQSFEVDGDGRWYMSRMEFVGEGNLLFVRRRIESEFEFADYFLPPPGTVN